MLYLCYKLRVAPPLETHYLVSIVFLTFKMTYQLFLNSHPYNENWNNKRWDIII
jgi:hypothetical protein